MRVLITGAGRAGVSLAASLARAGHRVAVIERDDATGRRAYEQHGLVMFAGDATEASVLRDAEAGRADVVVAMLRRDADNLAVALLAREFGARRVIVRMRDVAYRAVYIAAGVQEIFSETDVLVGALATAVEHPLVRHSMVLAGGEAVAFEVVVPPDASVAGKSVREVGSDPQFPRGCVFASVSDAEGAVSAPRGDSVLVAGAAVLIVAQRNEVAAAIEYLTGRRATKT